MSCGKQEVDEPKCYCDNYEPMKQWDLSSIFVNLCDGERMHRGVDGEEPFFHFGGSPKPLPMNTRSCEACV